MPSLVSHCRQVGFPLETGWFPTGDMRVPGLAHFRGSTPPHHQPANRSAFGLVFELCAYRDWGTTHKWVWTNSSDPLIQWTQLQQAAVRLLEHKAHHSRRTYTQRGPRSWRASPPRLRAGDQAVPSSDRGLDLPG